MKIQELIVESQVTDEGVLGSIASGAGTALGAVGKGLGAISGAFKGAKDQFQKGQALGRAHVGGHMPKQPKDTSVRDQEFARLTGKTAPGAPNAAAGGGDPKALRAQAAELTKQADELEKQQKVAAPAKPLETPPPTQPGIGQSSNANNAVATNTAPADTKVASAPAAQEPAAAPAQEIVGKGGSKFDMETGKPFTDQAAADAQDDKIAAANAAKQAAAPAGQPNLQVQQGGKNPALDARRAALAQSKADTAAGKGVTGAIKSGTLGEGFYSKFFDAMI